MHANTTRTPFPSAKAVQCVALALVLGLSSLTVEDASAQSVAFGPAADGDLRVDRLVHLEPEKASRMPTEQISRTPVRFTYPLDRSSVVDADPRPYVSESRSYWLEVTGDQLRQGVALPTTAAGAVVRLNPVARSASKGTAIDPSRLELQRPDGEKMSSTLAMEALADAEALAAAGAPFVDGTTAFRLREELGSGTFRLRTLDPQKAGSRWVVNVFEPASDSVLELTADRASWIQGERLRARISVRDGELRSAPEEVEAFATSPDGRAFPLELHRGRGSWTARLPLEMTADAGRSGLWEIHASTFSPANGRHAATLRSGRTVFSMAVPTARLDQSVVLDRDDAGPTLRFGVEVATAGRYELRATLFGTDRGGELRPFAVAHSADWLEDGRGTIALGVEQALLDDADLGAPFQVRDLRLVNQGRMELIEQRSVGAVVTP